MNKKTFIYIAAITILLSFFVLVIPARAQGIVISDSVPKNQVVDQNLILSGDTVTIDGTVNGDVLAVGRNVELNGSVNGTLVILATDALINGFVASSLYNGAITVVVSPEARIGRDFYNLSGDVKTNTGSSIGRDMIAVTLGALLQGEVKRNTHGFIGIGPLITALWDKIQELRLPELEFPNLESPENMPKVAFASLIGSSIDWIVEGYTPNEDSMHQSTGIQGEVIVDWLLERLRALVIFLVFGGLFLWLFPRFLEESVEVVWQKPLQSTAWGLVILVFLFSAFLLSLGLLIPLMLFFSTLTLDALAVFTGLVGYSGLILGMVLFLIYGLYITKVVAAYLVGKKLMTRFTPRAARFRLLVLFVGGLLYVLIRAIPYLGAVVGLWLSLMGVGAAFLIWQDRRKRRGLQEPGEPVEALTPESPDLEEEALESKRLEESSEALEVAQEEIILEEEEQSSEPTERSESESS
jgi:hypothetical protein